MDGLTSAEVAERRSKGLVNDTEVKTSRTYTDIIVKNVVTPLNIILIILGVSLFFLGNVMSAISATGIITVNIVISTVQEMRAKHRLDKISLLTRPKVTVMRDGEETPIDQSDIVKDDLVIIRAGEQALVDGELVSCRSLEMDESLLTGESSTVRKAAGDHIYSGSICVTGEGRFVVTAFGAESYASQMLSSAKKFTSKKTPLQMETETITTILMIIAFSLLFLSVIVELLRGVDFLDPEGFSDVLEIFVICLDIVPVALFLLITLTYMIAAIRMANKGVLLQRFNSVESLSHVDTVCMDKTGTITTNNLLFESAQYLIDQGEAERMIRLFASNTGSRNRTMKALLDNYGEEPAELIDEVQFNSSRKFSAVKVRSGSEVFTLYSGAWTMLREKTSGAERIDGIINAESSKGFRTLIICRSADRPLYDGDDAVINDLEPVAVVSIRDEVRADCRETIQVFLDNNMDLKVISGDDPVTVDALFKIANIPGERRITTGPEMDSMSEEQLTKTILDTNIFGRMRPENKEKVIEVLKKNGRYVAMIGDGVNDVKPIKSAQVGVSLESGSGAARGVADMILVDDNFAALPKALVEGRRTVSGIRDILKIYISRNFALAIMFAIVFFLSGNLPLLPIQNLIYAFVAVSFISFFMTIFARPDNNKELILPDVLRFSVPSSVTIGAFAVVTYAIVWMMADKGIISLDLTLLADSLDQFGLDFDEFVNTYLVWNNDYNLSDPYTRCEILARNSLVLFASTIGALQLLIVCPRYKFLSADGKVNRRILPIILVVLSLLMLCAMYIVPAFAGLLGMVMVPTYALMVIIGMVILAFFTILLLVKRDVMHRTVEGIETWYMEKLEKAYTKGDVVDVEDPLRPDH